MTDNNFKENKSKNESLIYNTLQFEQIELLKSGLDFEFSKKENFFVANNLIWYPEAKNSENQMTPDIMVVNRPKAQRHAYQQWKEENIAPLVVFEVISPIDNFAKLLHKFKFYEANHVQEFYLFNPENQTIEGWIRQDTELVEIEKMDGFRSPSLGIVFKSSGEKIEVFHANGCKFKTYTEINTKEKRNKHRQDIHRRLTESKVRMMVKKLREMGVNPDELKE